MAEISGGDGLSAHMRGMSDRISNAKEVRVGFLENAIYPDGTPVAMVAAINNYGAPAAGIPPRPFFSNMIADKSPQWSDRFGKIMKATDFDAHQSLELMGEGIAGQLREAIVDFDSVPNSPVTDLLKQRFPTGDDITFADVMQARHDVAAGATAPPGKPLTWSGKLLGSVDKEVE